jgi:ribose transport system ATP-binding protein
MTTELAIEVRDVCKAFPGVVALDQVSLAVRKGEVLALLGENGAGKSTLLKIMSGVYSADQGSIHLDGEPVRLSSPSQARQLGICLVHQELQQVPDLTVTENIFLAQELYHPGRLVIDRAASHRQAEQLLARIGVSLDVRARIRNYGIAERQMIEIAKALLGHAKVIAFDEPTSSLSKLETGQLFKVIRELKRDGVGLIYVSHRLEEILAIADTLTILRDGRTIISGQVADFDQARMVRHMVGRNLEDMPAGEPRGAEAAERPVVLEVAGLHNRVVKNLSFSLRQGEILGIAGLVGSGRTELIRAIYGADPAEGSVKVLGHPLTHRTPQKSIRAGLGLIPEDRKGQAILRLMSVQHNIVMASIHNAERCGVLSGGKLREAVRGYFGRLNIRPGDPEMVIANLSGGNQQKAVLARSLLANSSILFFDEPTRGIDVGAKSEIYLLMRELARQGKSIVMVSSELQEILLMSDRILVMREGRLAGELPREQANEENIMHYATGGK